MAIERIPGVLFGLAAAAGLGSAAPAEDAAYRAEIDRWRSEREARLKADDGWPTVAGLFWLKEGENAVGTDPRADVVLPEGSAPARVGVFELREGRKDGTSKETYPAGRFLYAERPKDGTVVLDFNKAYNPPCAFTPYATCPLPPEQNRLTVRIEAGELSYGRH